MKKGVKYLYIIAILLVAIVSLTACKTPYTPPPITAVSNYLVVEGLIDITDSTYINLSRTVSINNPSTVKPELKATVTIENNLGGSYPLTELGNGVYAAAPLNLSASNQYHLRIKISNGEQYASDFVPTSVSPPIDSISWKATASTLNIYANTHDPNNATRYYRWDFTEEWEFHSNYDSYEISNGLQIINRLPSQQIYFCYTGDVSNNITLGNSAGLSSDVISQQLINTIPSTAEKIGMEYSILVKQYALTKDAYDYWNLLKTNTEQLGSIFDAQPSSTIGNIHSLSNPAEVVIGYISAGTIATQRIFIHKSQLPNWQTAPFYPLCETDSLDCCPPCLRCGIGTTCQFVNYLCTGSPGAPAFQGPLTQLIPIDPITPVGTLAAAPECVDCTLRGHTTVPPYWK